VRRNKEDALVSAKEIAGFGDTSSNVKRFKPALGRHRQLQF
jgi:hypothetical protein